VHSQNDSRDDRKFQNLLESLRRVKGAKSGDEATFMTPSDRPWRHVWEVERLKRSFMLLEAKPEFKVQSRLAFG
jgi:hypothetical protein